MGFLAKLASVIIQGAKIFAGFAPLIEGASPGNAGVIQTVSTDLSAIANLVVQVETQAAALASGGTKLTGEQKMAMLLPLVSQLVMASNTVSGKKVADPALLQKAIGEIAQGAFDVVNALHVDNVDALTSDAIKT